MQEIAFIVMGARVNGYVVYMEENAVKKYEDYCLDFIQRHKFSAREIDNGFVSDYKARYGLLKPI